MIELKGQKILILGASGFIGSQVAIKLSKLGANVIISGRNEEKLQNTFSKLEGSGNHSRLFDIKDLNNIQEFLKNIVNIDGKKISGLVYCNGIATIRPLKTTTPEFLHDMMITNYYAFIEMVKKFSDKRICTKNASIVALSSYASNYGNKGQLAYSATKAAMDSSIKIIAKELYSKGIKINSIRPAALLPEEINFDDLPLSIQELITQMKTGPIDSINIAEMIAFLISKYSDGITGKCLDVKGYLQ